MECTGLKKRPGIEGIETSDHEGPSDRRPSLKKRPGIEGIETGPKAADPPFVTRRLKKRPGIEGIET